MSISYRDVPKIYLRRSLQESIFMLFCYARAVITVVFGFKVSLGLGSVGGVWLLAADQPSSKPTAD